VGLFSNLFSKDAARYFSPEESQLVVQAVRDAERQTSGEVRVFVESRCRYVDPMLVYLAMRDHQFAVFADEGIYREMGADYWNKEAAKMLAAFKKESYAEGLVTVVKDIGEALKTHFPFDHKEDKNELPDDIIFGK
jgi:uncharacterized membrane protein